MSTQLVVIPRTEAPLSAPKVEVMRHMKGDEVWVLWPDGHRVRLPFERYPGEEPAAGQARFVGQLEKLIRDGTARAERRWASLWQEAPGYRVDWSPLALLLRLRAP